MRKCFVKSNVFNRICGILILMVAVLTFASNARGAWKGPMLTVNVNPANSGIIILEQYSNGIWNQDEPIPDYPWSMTCFIYNSYLRLTAASICDTFECYKFDHWTGENLPAGFDPLANPVLFYHKIDNTKVTAVFTKVSENDLDGDCDGYTENQGDCDDTDSNVNPKATEICDLKDNNCNGIVDEGCQTYYRDMDNDGFGNIKISKYSMTKPSGYVSNNTDCNDNNTNINPSETEICEDGIDQNCDGKDISCDGVDKDGDGFTIEQGDCNDNNIDYHPGANEPCGSIDFNCDNLVFSCLDVDDDKDGYTENDGDCNDNDKTIYPGALEICDDCIDQDCNGEDVPCKITPKESGEGACFIRTIFTK